MDIDDRVPYRLGTSKLPPLPIDWKIVGEHFPPKVQEACSIVEEYFKGELVSLFYIHRHGEERNTVLTLSTYNPALKDKWREAIEKLYECFKHEQGLVAEIADYSVFNPNLPKSITTVEIDLYQVAALIDDHEWMAVDVVRWYSPVRGVYWPTIAITARDAGKESWWSKKIPAIEQFVKDQGLDLEVVLRVLDHMPTHPEGDLDEYKNEFSRDVYKDFQKIGQSLGIQNVDGSVSLGCRILVEDGCQFGVTSYRRFQQGAELTQTGLVGLNIQTPSSHDDFYIKKCLLNHNKLEHLQPCNLGKIVAVSSRSLLTDWCLFELDRSEFVWKDPKVWAQIKDGKTYQVKKWGRSTGLTEGTISIPPSIINSKYMEHAQGASPIISVRCIVSSKGTHFFLPGDNGAFVQENDSGAILGFCAAYNKATKVSYMTPMATIIGEIDNVLTSKIKEPKEIQIRHDTCLAQEDQNIQQLTKTATFS
ncbi:hypothetical protein EJ04DRAFT_530042 [Polyplosphaeria fusca]|uniref:Uncharacterized protein n=1 Tax=Polyplosphaeria fusca TaxID=682080 RepID=A0A9P4UW12_9PLEO|nr:hypothetical protein EJ04DRAFT_530042 [Polyplosphaeria fusca]